MPTVNPANAVGDRCFAETWVVADPASPDEETLWTAMMFGGHIVDKRSLCSNGRQGVAFHVAAAVESKRWFFMSDDFTESHPALAVIVRRAMASSKSKWVKLKDWAEFATKNDTFAGPHLKESSKCKYKALALASSQEANALNDMVNVFDRDAFRNFWVRMAVATKGFCSL